MTDGAGASWRAEFRSKGLPRPKSKYSNAHVRDPRLLTRIALDFVTLKPRILFQKEISRLIAQESIVIFEILQVEALRHRHALHMRDIVGGILQCEISMTGVDDAFERPERKGDEVRALSIAR